MNEDEDRPDQPFDFGNTDSVLMIMNVMAVQLIDKTSPIQKQGEAVAAFQAVFMGLRGIHETDHTTAQHQLCPFCAALKLSAKLNRE